MMKSKKEHDYLEIAMPVFGAIIVVGIGVSGRDKIMKRWPGVEIDRRHKYEVGTYELYSNIGNNNKCPYMVPIHMKKVFWPSTIAHEAYHATCELMEALGDKISRHNEEVVAYIIQYIVMEYTDHFLNISARRFKSKR